MGCLSFNLLFVLLFASFILKDVIAGAHDFRWCCKSLSEKLKCEELRERVDRVGRRLFPFSCVYGRSTYGCMQKIKHGVADLISLDGGDIFYHKMDITVVAAENGGLGDASYYAIAVVKRHSHPGLSMLNLAGAKTCHTGVGKTSGWNMPIGWLYRNGFDPDELIRASCAPGARDPSYFDQLPGRRRSSSSKWCSLCAGDEAGNHVCDRDHDERYYGYDGAFTCMKEDRGDIAFVKQSTVPLDEQDDYELLCPDGTRLHPSQWINCTLGKVPAHAVVMRKDATYSAAHQVFIQLQNAINNIRDFNTWGGKNLLWCSSVTSFLPKLLVPPEEYLGNEYLCNMRSLTGQSAASTC